MPETGTEGPATRAEATLTDDELVGAIRALVAAGSTSTSAPGSWSPTGGWRCGPRRLAAISARFPRAPGGVRRGAGGTTAAAHTGAARRRRGAHRLWTRLRHPRGARWPRRPRRTHRRRPVPGVGRNRRVASQLLLGLWHLFAGRLRDGLAGMGPPDSNSAPEGISPLFREPNAVQCLQRWIDGRLQQPWLRQDPDTGTWRGATDEDWARSAAKTV
jgi:hypothetical protein